jgi:hypothetical protein
MELSCSSDYLADAKVIKFLFLEKKVGVKKALEKKSQVKGKEAE